MTEIQRSFSIFSVVASCEMECGAIKSDQELEKVRLDYFTHKYRPGYICVDGVTLPDYFNEVHEEIENLEVHDNDVWLTCFPRSGSTWAREVIWAIGNDLKLDNQKESLPYRFPLLEFCSLVDIRKHAKENKDFIAHSGICDSIKIVKNAKRPRFIETHLPWNLLPKQIRNYERRPKIIHLARNPKDTCVAYFHHCKLIEGYTGNFEDFWQLFIKNKLIYTPYWDNVLSYWNKREDDNILFITYEDMKKNLSNVVRSIGTFLGKTLNEAQMEIILKHLNYESMKDATPVHLEPIVEFLKQFNLCQNETGHFMRAGLIGNYRAQMCADVIDIFDKWTEEHTQNTGLKFDISKYISRNSLKI